MKRCPLGHENPDAASRCDVCLARFFVLPVSLVVDGVPEVPVEVPPGEPSLMVLRLAQDGGVARPCTVVVSGEAAAWTTPEHHQVLLGPGEVADVRLRVAPPAGTSPGLWSLALRIEAGPDEAPVDADLLLQVLAPGPDPAPSGPPPPPPQPATSDPVVRPWLESGGGRYPLRTDETVLGRGIEADIVLDDPGISRQHCALLVTGDGTELTTTLRDLGSTNGTSVNGERVATRQLTDGDRLTLGHTELTFAEGGD